MFFSDDTSVKYNLIFLNNIYQVIYTDKEKILISMLTVPITSIVSLAITMLLKFEKPRKMFFLFFYNINLYILEKDITTQQPL